MKFFTRVDKKVSLWRTMGTPFLAFVFIEFLIFSYVDRIGIQVRVIYLDSVKKWTFSDRSKSQKSTLLWLGLKTRKNHGVSWWEQLPSITRVLHVYRKVFVNVWIRTVSVVEGVSKKSSCVAISLRAELGWEGDLWLIVYYLLLEVRRIRYNTLVSLWYKIMVSLERIDSSSL